MANLENLNLKYLRMDAKEAYFEVSFKIKQNAVEKSISQLKWNCYYEYYGADANGVRVPLYLPFVKTYRSTSETYIDCKFNTSLDLRYLDEDPWYTFPHNEDEICIKIDLKPVVYGIVKDSDMTNWVRKQFGT